MKISSVNPCDQSIVGETECIVVSDLSHIVESSRVAGRSWSTIKIEDRLEYIKKYRDSLVSNKQELANIITVEMGKPITQSIGEIEMELEYLDFYISKSVNILKEKIVRKDNDVTYKIIHEPLGVFVCIAPWNFPLTMFHTGVIPALIAGNTVVFKPSELSTISQSFAANLMVKTGLPEDVMQIAVGGKEVGAELINQNIDAVWFTGSTKVGKEIYKKAGAKFIKVLLEMGGNSAAIVMNDANIDNAVENIFWGRYLCNGQVCNADKRLFVQSDIYDKFMAKFIERIKSSKVGNPIDENTEIGPVVSTTQLDTLMSQLEDALSSGARVLIGGKRSIDPELFGGNYLQPTVISDVNSKMRVMQEEVFGPILPVMKFSTIEEVVELVNDSIYGLSGEVYTTNEQTAKGIAEQLKVGTVGINTSNYFKPECPFGGYRLSGLGREYGEEGFLEFVQTKTIVTTGLI